MTVPTATPTSASTLEFLPAASLPAPTAASVSAATKLASAGNRSLLFLPVAFGAACLSLAATLDGDTGPELCVFRKCTGGYCPGCGGSRAFVRLAKGDLAGSWAAHPWVPLLVLQLFVAAAMVSTGRSEQLRSWVVPFLVGNLVLGLTIWAIRLSMGTIPIPFA